jgi:uncharacterized protein
LLLLIPWKLYSFNLSRGIRLTSPSATFFGFRRILLDATFGFVPMKVFSLFFAILICTLAAFVGPEFKSLSVPDQVADRFVPAPYGSQKIGGILGERMRVNLEGRLLQVDEKGIIECFQHRPGAQDWAGEHAGKFLHAAVNTWLYTRDERIKTLMDRIARQMIATQLSDGYLGTYTDDKRWTSWDVWVHKYDLIGLLSYYQATGNGPALDASKKVGDLLYRTFGTGSGQKDIIKSGEHMGMAATSVLEPMAYLYRLTGDPKYLEFCNYIVSSWNQPNGPAVFSALRTPKPMNSCLTWSAWPSFTE